MRARSSTARSCCKNRYSVTLTFAPLTRNTWSKAQTQKNSMVFVNFCHRLRPDRQAASDARCLLCVRNRPRARHMESDGSRQPYSNFSNRPHPPRQNRGAVLMGIAVWRVTEKPKKIKWQWGPYVRYWTRPKIGESCRKWAQNGRQGLSRKP